jgi:hypothetical protein
MAFEADSGFSTVLVAPCAASTVGFLVSGRCLVLSELTVGAPLLRRASSRGPRDGVSWRALACQMAGYRGP